MLSSFILRLIVIYNNIIFHPVGTITNIVTPTYIFFRQDDHEVNFRYNVSWGLTQISS